MEHLSPPSEEIRLRDEDSDIDESLRRTDQIKRIKLKQPTVANKKVNEERKSVTRKVPIEEKPDTFRDK